MGSIPVTRGPSAALYPFTLTIAFDTGLGAFENGAQQRSARNQGLAIFDLNYSAFSQAQKNTFKSAFTSAKGGFTTNLSLTLGSTTYNNLSFDTDEMAWQESPTAQYSTKVRLRQTLSGTFSPGTPRTPFPALANGAMGQLPYTQKKRFQTIATQMAAGPKYAYAEFAGGLTGFPADGLMAWELDERMLTDADIATRINHFIANWGSLYPFSFTDEDSTVYTSTHYASDQLVVTYSGVNNSSVKILLEQTN